MSHRSHPICTDTLKASGAITAHRFVQHEGTQAENNEAAYGVARHAVTAGEAVAVDIEGVVPVEAGGTITLGAAVQSDAQGRAIAKTDAGVALGRALESARASGELIRVHLHRH